MRLPVVLLALLLLLPVAALATGQNTPGTAVTISGPERLAVSTDGSYNVKIYGPSDINWGFWVNVSGTDRENATLASADGTADSDRSYIMSQTNPLTYPEFNFTLTAPPKAGSLTVKVTALAMEGAGAAGQTASASWSVDVKAIRKVLLNSTVHNRGDIPISDFKVAFMVKLGGAWTYISNESVPMLEAGATANVTTSWDSSLLDPGEYTVRIVVDPDGEKAQYSGSGGTREKVIVLKEVGVKETEPWELRYQRLIVFIVVVVVAVAAVVYWYRRKKIV